MGWDFYTYESQPIFFIEEIMIFMKQMSEEDKQSNGKLNANMELTRPKGQSRYG